ncbi:MAG TPA: cytochrome c oxidase subunit 3 [Steroidobacter sp.]|jgi:cytochrome c oxidase subunit 3|nr:cytochrome c oxidase subunit 3 [Steroidobacteraceae bacterium]HLS82694.1 cytochrome c oxidase subunit 3 [Steroidobacter sp.]
MSLTAAYIALATGVLVWALLVSRLRVRPWEARPVPVAASEPHVPSAKVGLWVFLAVITSLFALFISAYYMRMGHGHGPTHDWSPIAEPRVLWLNSALLILASLAMQWAKASVQRADLRSTRDGLLLGGLLTLAFLGGQLHAWRELGQTDFFTPQNPALAFFYVLTVVHGAHLLGGLYVWTRTVARSARSNTEAIDVRMSVELCTVYWHYLLFVWLVLFALLLST